jgi:hypothetical protein
MTIDKEVEQMALRMQAKLRQELRDKGMIRGGKPYGLEKLQRESTRSTDNYSESMMRGKKR